MQTDLEQLGTNSSEYAKALRDMMDPITRPLNKVKGMTYNQILAALQFQIPNFAGLKQYL